LATYLVVLRFGNAGRITMRDMKKIAKIVKDTLANDFDNIKIIEVRVRDDLDSDGDEVLRVDVIFEGSRKDVDVSRLTGAVRHVRPKLFEADEKAFPVISFISRKEAGASKLVAA
jgi:hypothetical protein